MIENKRGQELSTNAIIMIIIGIIVLVVLVLGFTIGWDRLLPFISSNNIENVKTFCSTACVTGNQYDYCTFPRDVNDKINDKFSATCDQLDSGSVIVDGETLDTSNYGIESCSTISCSNPEAP